MADLTEQDKAEFPPTIHVRLEPDRDRDILIAGTDALDALGQCDQALLGVYQLVRVIDVRRSVEVREVTREAEPKTEVSTKPGILY